MEKKDNNAKWASAVGLGVGAAALLVFGLSACGGSGRSSATAAQAVPFASKPDPDPFYRQPATLPDLPRGTILNSRSITFAPVGGVPMPNNAWQLQFVSRDVNGKPIAAIATVVKPTIPAAGPSPLLSYQYAEDSLGSQCAPSHTLTGSTANAISQAEGASPLAGLAQGWTLVYPDHEGPDSAYAAGRLAGQITLDGVRAAEQFEPLGLSGNTQVGLWGYSGGAIATAWAATLQGSYAPELNVVGIANGGTPAALLDVARNGETNPVTNAAFFNLIFTATIGINRAYPQFLTPLLNERGRQQARVLANGCAGSSTDGSPPPAGKFADYTNIDDPLNAPIVQALTPKIELPQPGQSPLADTFVYHSIIDELIPIAGATNMVNKWCANGSTVHYYQGVTGEHAAFEITAVPLALAYLTSRFAGSAPILPPGTQTCN